MTIDHKPKGLESFIGFCLDNKLIIVLLFMVLIGWGIGVAPFDWNIPGFSRDPVPVDAIPDIGENQQIVFTPWMGRSPQDVEDQITYPLTAALMGLPEVKTIRSYSMFGFSTIYVIFKESAEFYWSRSRILEKLNSLPMGTLPDGVNPSLGPDATALGQVFWYTLEGRDEEGKPTGGWDLHELRSIQDWTVRYALQSAEGVSEVASVGGHIKEYQIDVDPAALRESNVSLTEIFNAVRNSNLDVGARTIEINRVEYVVRGLGFIKDISDIEYTVIKSIENVPLYVKDVAHVSLGPALRRGVLDKAGAEVVGGVAVVRYGDNPMATIKHIKEKIAETSPGLPKKTLADGRVSQVTIVPFYDRTELIQETLGTLNHALRDEILVTIIVVMLMVMHLKTSLLITGILPLTVLLVFIGMRVFGVDANIVALSGIAIAIGTIVDMGIVVSENILKHLDKDGDKNIRKTIMRATAEVGGAVVTAVSTTIVSFLPVFAMEAAEGKLFRPLAYTKTFALIGSVIVALTLLPIFAQLLYKNWKTTRNLQMAIRALMIGAGLFILITIKWWIGLIVILYGVYPYFKKRIPVAIQNKIPGWSNYILIAIVMIILSSVWMPLGFDNSSFANLIFVAVLIGIIMGLMMLFVKVYPKILRWGLDYKGKALAIPGMLTIIGFTAWLGFGNLTLYFPQFMKNNPVYSALFHTFPGMGKEFMPPLDEGSFLYMPTTMPHAGIEEATDVLQKLDKALMSVPEVETVVGKLGRADTPLDPAPVSMIETIVNYKSEYIVDEHGNHELFKKNKDGIYPKDEHGNLIPDENGKPFRQWRDHILTNEDIWDELVKVAKIPGTTSAPKLQPISARLVMLQSGMRAPMGIKVKGPDLETIERVGMELEHYLKEVHSIEPATVFADRIVGKPYLEIEIDRKAIARYGIPLKRVQDIIEVAVGGKTITYTVEGRERYPVRVRYMRELRDNIESIEDVLVPANNGAQIPLIQLASIHYVRGPQMIKSEDSFIIGYVLFDKKKGFAEVDVVEQAQVYLQNKLDSGEWQIPAGVSYTFAGSYENQIRATKKLRVILPLSLIVIFMILYMQFRRVSTTLIVFSGIAVAWAGGFTMLWLYGQDWFLNVHLGSVDFRSLFQIHPVNLSIAVWVGFLALFGIATDDGVIISTYLDQSFRKKNPQSIAAIRETTILAGSRRIRPAMMTAATTILALIPILTSTGRGSDVMVPMAIPSFGGMVFVILTTFVVPIVYCWVQEIQLGKNKEIT